MLVFINCSIMINYSHNNNIIIIVPVYNARQSKYTILYTCIHMQPRDPCPTYPVESYVFNISEDSGYVTTTICHIGNTSLNINGSDLGLLYNQVYHLMIEAVNAIGSTYSEEIIFCKSVVLQVKLMC